MIQREGRQLFASLKLRVRPSDMVRCLMNQWAAAVAHEVMNFITGNNINRLPLILLLDATLMVIG